MHRAFQIGAARQRLDDVDTVRAELVTQERVQCEQLQDDVRNVDKLTEEIQRHQVVALTSAAQDAAGA